ncbi:MAG: TadE-like protein [Chloroflexota bacterium]|jgi:Flp pilus assembly protein TadG|nr:TadE-like protein [Chloroflexota bacterium]
MMSRRENRRGQALTEFALLAPVLLGFLALTLQGGIVISDQVNLEHYAYEGAQWAVANRTAATSGTISGHIQDQLCGSGVAIGSSSG